MPTWGSGIVKATWQSPRNAGRRSGSSPSSAVSDKAWGDLFRNRDLQNLKKRISLLNVELRRFFGIDGGGPIAYKGLAGYQAAFKLRIEKHVVEKVRERHLDHADEDEDEDIEQVMSEPPG
jgi:hypothetical protein